jgi:octaprenyl-diphosphate synthase
LRVVLFTYNIFAYFCTLFANCMNIIESIKATLKPELELFDKALVNSLQTDNPILEGVNSYIFQRAGKKFRPLLVMLAARMAGGGVNMAGIHASIAIELLHTATLVHDDVIDDTMERRGSPSVNARWGNKVAVLSGDYMLSTALQQVAKTGNIEILHAISFIGMQLSDGELLQLNTTQQTRISEAEYFRIIRKKTAYLFAVCAEVGAISGGATKEQTENLKQYGEYLGLCFQIRDDIFDYYDQGDLGKPTGNDVRDGKVTLPLIYALQHASAEEREKVVTWINLKNFTQENIEYISRFARENGGVDYAIRCMEDFRNKATEALRSFEDNETKQALIDCATFAVNRQR